MKTIVGLLLIVIGCACSPHDEGSSGQRSITDMAGRTVRIPRQVKKIFSVNPNGSILVYTMDPDLLLGWNYRLPAGTAAFMPRKYRELPHYGQMFGKSVSASEEEIVQQAPDLILCMWPPETRMRQAMERLEKRLRIPVVIFDNTLTRIPEAYTLLGVITGKPERARVLAEQSRGILARAEKVVSVSVKQPCFYYGFSRDGLTTIADHSIYMDIFRLCGLRSIIKSAPASSTSRITIQMEQLLQADPATILIGDNGTRQSMAERLRQDEKWQALQAVKTKQVFSVPNLPFHWLDKPPSVNRLAGILWLLWIFYPEVDDTVFAREVKTYYREFYHLEVAVTLRRNMVTVTPLKHI